MTRCWCQTSRICAESAGVKGCRRSTPMISAPSAGDNCRTLMEALGALVATAEDICSIAFFPTLRAALVADIGAATLALAGGVRFHVAGLRARLQLRRSAYGRRELTEG